MIIDFQILPRGAGKSTLAKRAASTSPNALYLHPPGREPRSHPTFTRVSSMRFISDPPSRNRSYSTIVIDDLFQMPWTVQRFICDHHHRIDFYIYTSHPYPDAFYPPFLNLLESEHPEFLI